MAKINYKGKEVEIKVNNRALMLFELNGGSMSDFETKPVSASITLACACLGLEGNPLDHANDLPSLNEMAGIIKEAMDESGIGEAKPKGK